MKWNRAGRDQTSSGSTFAVDDSGRIIPGSLPVITRANPFRPPRALAALLHDRQFYKTGSTRGIEPD